MARFSSIVRPAPTPSFRTMTRSMRSAPTTDPFTITVSDGTLSASQRIDRVIVRNEGVGAGRAVDEKRAIGTVPRYVVWSPPSCGGGPPRDPRRCGTARLLRSSKVPLVTVKSSNTFVSFRSAPSPRSASAAQAAEAAEPAECTRIISGTKTPIDGSGGSVVCAAASSFVSIKLMGCTGSGSKDLAPALSRSWRARPVGPPVTPPFASDYSRPQVPTLTEDPILFRTMVSPGSSTMMCRGILLGYDSNLPCSRSLYPMLSSSRNVAFGSAAWTSLIIEKVSAASDNIPNPPAWARPRMLPTGVSTVREPFFATWPAMKAKVPVVTPNRAECGCRWSRRRIRSAPRERCGTG